ncbi:MAG TPA: hypothetical protein VHO84_06390 [Syntrophorhabdaceae bacterium]|nr:hypothetical protein [Syntrophorhabdaceae bacterium]
MKPAKAMKFATFNDNNSSIRLWRRFTKGFCLHTKAFFMTTSFPGIIVAGYDRYEGQIAKKQY